MADIFVINKSDRPGARQTRLDLEQMLDMSLPTAWRPPIVETVASEGRGVEDLWAEIRSHESHLAETGELETRQDEAARTRVPPDPRPADRDRDGPALSTTAEYGGLVESVISREIDPYEAADRLVSAAAGSGAEGGQRGVDGSRRGRRPAVRCIPSA